jgi:hypothetical protein
LRLPKPKQLEDISSLPLSVPVLLAAGVLTVPSTGSGLPTAIDKLNASDEPPTQQVEVDAETYSMLLARSVEVCQLLHDAGRQEGLSYFDIHLAVQALEEEQKKTLGALVLIPSVA